MASWKKVIVSGSAADLASLTLDTQLAVAEGGTGATTLTSGYALLGNGGSAVQMVDSTADSTMLVGNDSTMVAESGATLRTSIGCNPVAGSTSITTLGTVTTGQIGTDGSPLTVYMDGGEVDGATIGSETAAGATFTTLVATGDVDLGDATGDTITATGRFDSDIVPSTDSARDLGTSTLQWAELHVDTGHIDQLGSALDANTQAITNVDIDSGNIDATTIGATSPAAGTFLAGTFTTLDNASTVAGSSVTGSFTGSFVGDGSNLTGIAATSFNIDSLGAYGAATLHQTEDCFLVSDDGTEKKISFTNLQDSIFADVTGDAAIAAGGGLTIANLAVETAMIAADAITNAKIGDGEVDTEHIADDAIEEEHIGALEVKTAAIDNDAVTLAKMAALTRGTLIVGDSSGDPSGLTVGTANQIFQSDGTDAAWVTLGGDASLSAGTLSLGVDCVDSAEIADNAIDSEHYTDASIDYAHIQNVAANSILGRNANSTGVISAVALATTEILIGDGTGFTAAALSGDVEMNNAGVVAVGSASGDFTVTGDLTVNGATTTISTTNTLIEDKFTTFASGSTSDTDGGIIVQGAASSGYGLGYDSGTDRWGLDADLSISATNLVPDAYVGVIQVGTTAGDSLAAPIYGGSSYGHGTIYTKTNDSTIWIYA